MSVVLWNIASGVVALGIVALIVRGRIVHKPDLMFDGIPRGTIPDDPTATPTVPCPMGEEVPATDVVPSVPPAEAGILLDGEPMAHHVTAALAHLHATGAIDWEDGGPTAVIEDPSLAVGDCEVAIMAALAKTAKTDDGRLVSPVQQRQLQAIVATTGYAEANRENWFQNMTRHTLLDRVGFALMIVFLMAVAVTTVGSLMNTEVFHTVLEVLKWMYFRLWPILLLITLYLILYGIGISGHPTGLRRTALGRALTDQCSGYVEHVSLIDPDAVLEEQDEDAARAMMPWAILAGKQPRWDRAFADAKAMAADEELAVE